MLSKVLKDAGAHLGPVTWRRQALLPAPVGRARAAAGDSEAAQLRARNAELEAAIETQSRQSYAAGVREGEESARQRLESGLREETQQLAATVVELEGTRKETIHQAEADVVRLSMEIARRVLHRELSVNASALQALVAAAMEKLQAQEVHRLRVHPDQEKMVRACLERIPRGQSIAVVGDPNQPKGGAVFEIARGSLDASVETQLAEIERDLIDQAETRV